MPFPSPPRNHFLYDPQEKHRAFVLGGTEIPVELHAGEKLDVTRGEADGSGATIESRIVDPKSGRTVEIKWRLRPAAGQMKVRDVLIENISMAQTQRREFAAVLQQRGGKAEGLIAAVREKIADLDKKK